MINQSQQRHCSRYQALTAVGLLASILVATVDLTNGQLVFQQDGHTNSYSLSLPSYQQTFTRYFGGGNSGGAGAQQAGNGFEQQQQQEQQYQQHPNSIYQGQHTHDYANQQALLRQQEEQLRQLQALQHQQMMLQYQQQAQYQPQYQQQGQYQGQQEQYQEQPEQQQQSLLGVAYSPSVDVAQVKFSSNGLKYDFKKK